MSTSNFTIVVAIVFACIANSHACAQSASTPPPKDPSPAHERLRFLEGTWTTTDSTPEDGFRESCAWLPEGRRHMICRTRWNTNSGPREGMSVFSFDPKTGRYLYSGLRASGALVSMLGEEQNGRWLFTSEQGVGPARLRTRVIIEPRNDEGFDFLSEISIGDGPWTQAAKVVYKRVAQ